MHTPALGKAYGSMPRVFVLSEARAFLIFTIMTIVSAPSFSSTRLNRPSVGLLGGSRKGFSLVEILIVIALIAILATLAITSVGNIFSGKQEETASIFVTQSLKTPLTAYRTSVGNYPSTADGLNALLNPPAGKEARWKGPYIDGKVPFDPWGNPYQYKFPGTHNPRGYDIWSMGPDGTDGTTDDIGNWESATK
jgi:general secretion pathway protein G